MAKMPPMTATQTAVVVRSQVQLKVWNLSASMVGPTPSNSIDVEEDCRELTFEESLERQEPGLSFYDEHPGTIDVWVSRDDALIHRIELGIPPDDPVGEEGRFTIKYLLFNEVEIEAP